MNNKQLYILRGLPSSGKTEVADLLAHNCDDVATHSIEDYFYNPKTQEYTFKLEELSNAYADCLAKTEQSLQDKEINVVVVHNIFATAYECKPYFDLAEKHNASVRILSMFDSGMHDGQLEELNINGWRKGAIQSKRKAWELNVYPHRQNKRPRNNQKNSDLSNQMIVLPYEALANLNRSLNKRRR